MQRIWKILMAIMLALVNAAPAPASEPSTDYRHERSGFVFPIVVGAFKRSALAGMTQDGSRIAAQYDVATPGHEMSVSVEIYPAPHILPSARNARTEADVCNHQSVSFDREMEREYKAPRAGGGAIPSPSPRFAETGRRSVFAGPATDGSGPIHIETYLFCRLPGEWTISYIATAPAENDLTADLADFAKALAWPPLTDAPLAGDRRNIIVVRSKYSDPTYMLRGIVISGPQRSIDQLETAAAPHGIETYRVEDEATPQIVASFDAQTKISSALDLTRRARNGSFDAVKLELLLLPIKALTGEGDERDAIEYAPADAIEGL